MPGNDVECNMSVHTESKHTDIKSEPRSQHFLC